MAKANPLFGTRAKSVLKPAEETLVGAQSIQTHDLGDEFDQVSKIYLTQNQEVLKASKHMHELLPAIKSKRGFVKGKVHKKELKQLETELDKRLALVYQLQDEAKQSWNQLRALKDKDPSLVIPAPW